MGNVSSTQPAPTPVGLQAVSQGQQPPQWSNTSAYTQPNTNNSLMQPSYSSAGYINQGYVNGVSNPSAYDQSSSSSSSSNSRSYSSYSGNYQTVQNSSSSAWIWILLIIVIIIIVILYMRSNKKYNYSD